jgi:hypothetical protein
VVQSGCVLSVAIRLYHRTEWRLNSDKKLPGRDLRPSAGGEPAICSWTIYGGLVQTHGEEKKAEDKTSDRMNIIDKRSANLTGSVEAMETDKNQFNISREVPLNL